MKPLVPLRQLRIHLYPDPHTPACDFPGLARWLREQIPGATVKREPEFFAARNGVTREAADRLAGLRVRHPHREPTGEHLLPETEIELRTLQGRAAPSLGLLYDGPRLLEAARGLLPPAQRSLRHLHLVYTRRLLGSLGDDDHRYHARTLLASPPIALLSTGGWLQAPAMPKAYYLARRRLQGSGIPEEAIREKFRGKYLDLESRETARVARGFAMQALYYHLWGEAFCPDKKCMLYNAHWQEEMLAAMVKGGSLCRRHQGLLTSS